MLKTMDLIDDGSALNLSTGIFTSFVDFVKTASDILGFDPEVKGTSNTPEGVFARGVEVMPGSICCNQLLHACIVR